MILKMWNMHRIKAVILMIGNGHCANSNNSTTKRTLLKNFIEWWQHWLLKVIDYSIWWLSLLSVVVSLWLNLCLGECLEMYMFLSFIFFSCLALCPRCIVSE
jgi:hypothetical protein